MCVCTLKQTLNSVASDLWLFKVPLLWISFTLFSKGKSTLGILVVRKLMISDLNIRMNDVMMMAMSQV